VKITLIDGTIETVRTRADVEKLWKSDRVSLVEAASVLGHLLGLHPSNAHKVWAYLESL
jgi:hypothetical protein